jgi:hypothetical protein
MTKLMMKVNNKMKGMTIKHETRFTHVDENGIITDGIEITYKDGSVETVIERVRKG